MDRLFKNRNFRVFSLWYICLVLIAGSVTTVTYVKEIKREEHSYMLKLEEDVQNLVNYSDQSLRATINTCNSIFLSRWYDKYRNNANIYSTEFDGLKKIEIKDDIISKTAANAYITDILIITPYRDSVICKSGWYSISGYNTIYDMVHIDLSDAQSPVISTVSDSVCIITLKDTASRLIKGTICVLIDKKLFMDTLLRFLPDNAVYVRVEICDQILYESGDLSNEHTINTSSINWPQFSITIGSLSYKNSLMKERTKTYILVMIIVLLAGAILSAFITMIVLKPLSQIIKRFGGSFRQLDDPYQFLTDFVESYSEKNVQLSIEKENLNKSMSCFLSLMRNEILFGMLTDTHFDFHDDYTVTTIPWINDGYPYALAVLESKFQEETEKLSCSIIDDLTQLAIHFCTFTILNNDVCILFWFKDMVLAKKGLEQIKNRLEEISNDSYLLSVSDILTDPKKMGESYLKQKSEIEGLKQSQLDLPLSYQVELANILQHYNDNQCVEYLRKLRGQFTADAVMRFLARIASKYSLESIQISNQYNKYKLENSDDKKWDIITDFACELCQSINSIKHTSINETAEIIRRYIDENYCDPNLGIKQLSDHFSMHRTLISRILKKHYDVTFSDYLLDLRIKKAMELLENSDMNISEIGETVGYINYITFKRAFERYNGISPREFRIKYMENRPV